MRTMYWLDELQRDVKFGARQMVAAPTFTMVAVTTLALGIGATAAMFSVVNAVLLRPLPFDAPDRLAMVWVGAPGQDLRGRPSYAMVEAWRRSRSFEDIAVMDPVTVTLSGPEGAERIGVARVSPNFFPLLGIRAIEGRLLTDDDATQRRRLALISHEFWQERFGGSLEAIGASLVLDGAASQIVGVLPPGLLGLDRDVWEPHTLFPDWEERRTARNAGSWFAFGRLRPGVNAGQAEAEVSAIVRTLDRDVPAGDRIQGASVLPLSRYIVGDTPRLALWLLAGAVFCVLLVAAANVAGLSLARAVSRTREMAIRATLGATPGRIVRQMLAEGIALAAIAGVLGVYIAAAAVRVIQKYGPADLARLDEVDIDGRVLAGVVVATALTGILVSLAPALMRRYSRLPREEGARGSSAGAAARSIRRALVIAELALAIVLLTGAGLLIRSWQLVAGVDPGFRPQRILSLQLSTTAFAGPNQRADFYLRVLDELRSLRGVESTGIVSDLFVSSDAERLVTIDGGDRRGLAARAAARRRGQRGRLQYRGDPARPGPLLLQHRSAWRTGCGHRQRADGTAAVARPGSARPALQVRPAERRHSLAHGGRRGRRHAPAGPGNRADPAAVRGAEAESVAPGDAARSHGRGRPADDRACRSGRRPSR